MSNNKIKCFIAMAFGHQDCDQLYNRYIHPILKKNHVESIRVDTRQHKDDLNNFIIRMLKKSDIALADLTYARPSVYYEAGFAERQIPVIYTVREDHLSRTQVDDRLRVHFDLEMKKIISWSSTNDRTFGGRLKQRLTYFLEPIREKIDTETALQDDKKKFLSMSVHDRREYIRDKFASKLRLKRFWVKTSEETRLGFIGGVGLIGAKRIGDEGHFCCVLVGDSITKNQIYDTIKRISGTEFIHPHEEIKRCYDFYYFCTLKGLPESRLTSSFSYAKPTKTPGLFRFNDRGYFGNIPRCVSVHMFPWINSKTYLAKCISEGVNLLTNKKTNLYTNLIREGLWERILFSRKKPSRNRTAF